LEEQALKLEAQSTRNSLRDLVARTRAAAPLGEESWKKQCDDPVHLAQLRYKYQELREHEAWHDYENRMFKLLDMFQRNALSHEDPTVREEARVSYVTVMQVMSLPLQVEMMAKRREELMMGYDTAEVDLTSPLG
jgi:hypothetical protein